MKSIYKFIMELIGITCIIYNPFIYICLFYIEKYTPGSKEDIEQSVFIENMFLFGITPGIIGLIYISLKYYFFMERHFYYMSSDVKYKFIPSLFGLSIFLLVKTLPTPR